MENLIKNLREIRGVKSVKKQSGPVLRIDLFSREIKGSDASEIKGNLRKITPRIKSTLDDARKTVFSKDGNGLCGLKNSIKRLL